MGRGSKRGLPQCATELAILASEFPDHLRDDEVRENRKARSSREATRRHQGVAVVYLGYRTRVAVSRTAAWPRLRPERLAGCALRAARQSSVLLAMRGTLCAAARWADQPETRDVASKILLALQFPQDFAQHGLRVVVSGIADLLLSELHDT